MKLLNAVMVGKAEVLRWSSVRRRLHDRGHDDVIEALDGEAADVHCSIHGLVNDPIVATVQHEPPEKNGVGFMCPKCMNKDVQEQYEAEGRRGVS